MSQTTNITEADLELVRGIARKLRNELGLTSELRDLVAAGNQGLVEAHARFDPARGVQFSSFAYYRIRGAMIDHVRKSTTLSRRAYEKVRLAESANRVGEQIGTERGGDTRGRSDVAQTLNVFEQGLAQLTAGFALVLAQQNDPVAYTPEDALLEKDTERRLRSALECLDEKERALVEGHYYDGRQFDEVAKELGISKSWASRIHSKALLKLRAALD